MAIKAIFFDFDGTLVESAEIKTDAFRELFKEYKEVDKIVAYHKANSGVSRYQKFNYIYENILKKQITEEEKMLLSEKFSAIALGKVIDCKLVEGTKEFLREYSKKIKMYIVSATPEDELIHTIKEKRIYAYFNGIYGAPTKKSEAIKKVAGKYKLKENEMVMVGDSKADYEAAKDSGIIFIGRSQGNGNVFPKEIETAKDMYELKKLLKKYEN